jgi:hypothetical protein
MEFLVEFDITVPGGTPHAEVAAREQAESVAAASSPGRFSTSTAARPQDTEPPVQTAWVAAARG